MPAKWTLGVSKDDEKCRNVIIVPPPDPSDLRTKAILDMLNGFHGWDAITRFASDFDKVWVHSPYTEIPGYVTHEEVRDGNYADFDHEGFDPRNGGVNVFSNGTKVVGVKFFFNCGRWEKDRTPPPEFSLQLHFYAHYPNSRQDGYDYKTWFVLVPAHKSSQQIYEFMIEKTREFLEMDKQKVMNVCVNSDGSRAGFWESLKFVNF